MKKIFVLLSIFLCSILRASSNDLNVVCQMGDWSWFENYYFKQTENDKIQFYFSQSYDNSGFVEIELDRIIGNRNGFRDISEKALFQCKDYESRIKCTPKLKKSEFKVQEVLFHRDMKVSFKWRNLQNSIVASNCTFSDYAYRPLKKITNSTELKVVMKRLSRDINKLHLFDKIESLEQRLKELENSIQY